MRALPIALSLALIAGLAFVAAPSAHAQGVPTVPVAFGDVHVGVGVGIGIGHPVRRYETVPSGYWTTRYDRVYVPGRVIGYDAYGYPIYTAGHYELQPVRVWVPTVRVHRVRPIRSGIGIGIHFR